MKWKLFFLIILMFMASPYGTVCLHNVYKTDWHDPEKKARDAKFLLKEIEE